MKNETDVAVIGAGPYGLSIAAHLRARKVDFRIFGPAMHTWSHQMPKGMFLKSEGFASTLYDPDSALTLERFCQLNSIPYADTGLPVSLDTFIAYGREFQKTLVPSLEERNLVSLQRHGDNFRLELDNGEIAFARRVVLAVGISHFQHLPPLFSNFPEEFVTHTSQHRSLERFRERDVTVIGAGASALDVAALLKQAGASVRVVARSAKIHFHNPPGPLPRPITERLRAPMTGLGPSWKSWLAVKGPLLFHRMPQNFRFEVVRRHLGPAPGWFVRDAVVGQVELNTSSTVTDLSLQADRVHLQIAGTNGQSRWISTDHVIAGTGYKVDLRRLSFLSEGLLADIRSVRQTPVLSRSFESSVKGLYFVGASAAPSFGPLLRFAYGAGFTSERISRILASSRFRRASSGVSVRTPAPAVESAPDRVSQIEVR